MALMTVQFDKKNGEYLAIETRNGAVKARGKNQAAVREFARQWTARQKKRIATQK